MYVDITRPVRLELHVLVVARSTAHPVFTYQVELYSNNTTVLPAVDYDIRIYTASVIGPEPDN